MLRNSSGCIQVLPIWPVQGSPQACTLEPCRNQARWNGLLDIQQLRIVDQSVSAVRPEAGAFGRSKNCAHGEV